MHFHNKAQSHIWLRKLSSWMNGELKPPSGFNPKRLKLPFSSFLSLLSHLPAHRHCAWATWIKRVNYHLPAGAGMNCSQAQGWHQLSPEPLCSSCRVSARWSLKAFLPPPARRWAFVAQWDNKSSRTAMLRLAGFAGGKHPGDIIGVFQTHLCLWVMSPAGRFRPCCK